jgi:anti-sigma regulatory factor (Ser/Thr protein kinase)
MTTSTAAYRSSAFEHEALFYAGERDFVFRTSSFIRDGIAGGEPILVVVSGRKIDLLRSELGDDSGRVRFEDMADIGGNPAWIIPAWADFVAEQPWSVWFRGIGEPITIDRGPEELVECERHEALLNVAFDDGPPWRLLCPYDVTALPAAVLDMAARNHPVVFDGADRRPSAVYPGIAAFSLPFADPLPEPPRATRGLAFFDVHDVRVFVEREAAALGAGDRLDDLLLAVSEVATNSILYGGGAGTIRVWADGRAVVCEIRDGGRIADPLIGRRRPDVVRPSGFGLWLANRVCDLVQLRTDETGSTIRLRVASAR